MKLSLFSLVPILASLASLAILAIGAPVTQADVIYDNFGPGDTFDTGSGYNVTGVNAGLGFQSIAESFTLGANALSLDTITVAVSTVQGDTPFDIDVVTDAGGLPSNTVLESFNSLTPTGSLGNSFTPETITSVLHPSLTAGATYWVEVTPDNGNVYDVWNLNTTGALGLAANSGSGWSFSNITAPALRVTGSSAVPEPGAYALLGSLTLAGAAFLRRRRAR